MDQTVSYTSCAILLNSRDCTKYGRGRIYSDSPQLEHSLQSKFWSLMPRSRFFYVGFSIHHSPFTSATESFGEGCSVMVQERKDLDIQYLEGKKY